MIDASRVQFLNDLPPAAGNYVLYWMQASQRTRLNHALEYAIGRANGMNQPLLVGFGLMDDYPEANARHYAFMLEGLRDVANSLHRRGIAFVVRRGNPPDVALQLGRDASLIVCDRGYLRHQRRWRDQVADGAGRQVVQVESDVVVPVEEVSDKAEYAARTIRPKIQRFQARYLSPLATIRLKESSLTLGVGGDIDVSDPESALAQLKVDRTIKKSPRFTGGEGAAQRLLAEFVRHNLPGYVDGRREPSRDGTSTLAPYLHFGQISPVEIALAAGKSEAPIDARDAFLEELIVRRELAVNFVYYQPAYDSYDGLPTWARQTLEAHAGDARPYVYSRSDLEHARTHDGYWNAAQKEMTLTGFMHNSLRMYWGKKILEWKAAPRETYDDAIYLNNKYFLCGRDPASWANVGWLFGLHDRPWASRPIFGTVRYMNAGGLDRKFDMGAYVRKVEGIEKSSRTLT